MKRERRSFSPEFKHDSTSLVVDQRYSMAKAGRAVDVLENTLRKRDRQLKAERLGSAPKSKVLTPEQQRIQDLEARVNRLEREKAILKRLLLHS